MSKVLQRVRKFWLNEMEAITCIMFVLIAIGTINICSASLITAYTDFESPYYFLNRHLFSIFVGTVAFFIVSQCFNYRRLRNKYFLLAMFLIIVVMLIAVLFFGVEVNGSRRWLSLSVIQFQPSELAKFVTIILAALHLGPCLDKDLTITLNPRKNWTFLLCFFLAALVELEEDMGTAIMVIGIPVAMYVIAGLPRSWKIFLATLSIVGLSGFVALQPYRLARVNTWIDPWSDIQGDGYQVIQSMLAIGSGKFSGMGLGQGFSKYSYLPEAHTDFAFAVYAQETGFIGVMIIFLLIVALAFYCVKIAMRTRDGFGKMLVIGFTLLITCQAAINLSMIVGLLPVVGVPLPFISYGGTSLLLNMISVAIIINVGRHIPLTNAPNTQTIPADTAVHKTYTTKSGKVTHLRRVK